MAILEDLVCTITVESTSLNNEKLNIITFMNVKLIAGLAVLDCSSFSYY